MSFNHIEKQYYARHFSLPKFGLEGQAKLKNARVLVVGAGGLGCPVLQYLVAAGVGHIGIVDEDIVSMSNLHRQILYSIKDVGHAKAIVAKQRLQLLNPNIIIKAFVERFTIDNAKRLVADYDIVVDGTDNFPTRYLVNDVCVLENKTNVYGSIFRFEGQVAVFNHLLEDGSRSANYRDIFPAPPPDGLIPNCADAGVLGVLPGIIGSLQANEVIKVITRIGEPLINKILLMDSKDLSFRHLKFKKNPKIVIDHLTSYDIACDIPDDKQLSIAAFKKWQINAENFQLIDVRELHEYELNNLGGELIPLKDLEKQLNKLSSTQNIVVMCQKGGRSQKAVELLIDKYSFDNVYNLVGGIEAYLA